MKDLIQNILCDFGVKDDVESIIPLTGGHINAAYKTETTNGSLYTVQRINTEVFKNPDILMNNITAVTAHLKSVVQPPWRVLNFLQAENGKYYCERENCWRVYEFIDGVHTISHDDSDAMFKTGIGFGSFQQQLSSFDGSRLKETIPNFHNTSLRLNALQSASVADEYGRAVNCESEIKFALGHFDFAKTAQTMLKNGQLPLRVTHNDTKVNNILIDNESNEPVCIIDLDTVMPGLLMFDFGDAIRSGASTMSESDSDIENVKINLTLYEAFAKGFLSTCGSSLTEKEWQTLHIGAPLMTFENGVRFLTDYLQGDVYFGGSKEKPDINLIRAKNQFALFNDLILKLDDCRLIISSCI